MKKRWIGLLLVLCLMVAALCGCGLKEGVSMVITEEGQVTIGMVVAMDKELIQVYAADLDTPLETDEDYANVILSLLEADMMDPETAERLTPYHEGDYFGVQMTKDELTLADISAAEVNKKCDLGRLLEMLNSGETDLNLGEYLSLRPIFQVTGSTYTSNLACTGLEELAGMNMDELLAYGVEFQMEFVVTLPVDPISHNATSVSEDGRTLTWNLLSLGSENINFSFEMPTGIEVFLNQQNPVLLIALFALVAVLLIVLIILIIALAKANKRKKEAEARSSETAAPTSEETGENHETF